MATVTRTQSSDDSSPSSSTETRQPPDSQTIGKNGTTAEHPPAWMGDLETIKAELEFTVPLLIQFPKCYWLWNHRLWVLNEATKRLPTAAARKVWETELGLVSKMLDKDRRNFHAWGYRRFVVANLEDPKLGGSSMVEAEFEYSTRMVHANLSNFSAWHNRSQLIPRLLAERGADDESRKAFLEKGETFSPCMRVVRTLTSVYSELAFIRDALNVGPEDQSLWFYQQYLISNLLATPDANTIAPSLTDEERKVYVQGEIEEIKDLLEDYTDIKWIYEALIAYTDSISRLGDANSTADSEELKTWLSKLRELDPGREGRWLDLERRLAPA